MERKLIPFFNIEGWMIRDLGLTNKNEIFVYATIFNFSCDGKSEYRGGRHYLAKSLNMPFSTLDRILNSLVEKDLIIKEQFIHRNMTCNNYKANLSKVNHFMNGEYNHTQNEYPTQNENRCTQNDEYITNNNNKEVKDKSFTPAKLVNTYHPRNFSNEKLTDELNSLGELEEKELQKKDKQKSKRKKTLYEKCIDEINNPIYEFSDSVRQRLKDFLPTTLQANEYAVKGINQWIFRLKALYELSKNPDEQLKIIEYSISHSITGFVTPKQSKLKSSYEGNQQNVVMSDPEYMRKRLEEDESEEWY